MLVTGLALLIVHAATAQTKPSDSEMKEVVRLLLEREVQRSADGGNVTVLLGPNVKSSWIPDASGFAIRQLSYDEQKRVPEYYDLTSSFKRSVIEVALTKGNYCRQVGRRYEFRRQAEVWQSKFVGYIESTAGDGRCDACAVGSGATSSVLPQTTEPPVSAPRAGNLRLTEPVNRADLMYSACPIAAGLETLTRLL